MNRRRFQAAERNVRSAEQDHVQRECQLALEEAYRECSEPDWDGYGAAPADEISMRWASKVLLALPAGLGVPEAAFEPDGAASLEWWHGPDRTLSVSIERNGEIRYPGRLNGARVVGTEMFVHGLPRRLLEALSELVESSTRIRISALNAVVTLRVLEVVDIRGDGTVQAQDRCPHDAAMTGGSVAEPPSATVPSIPTPSAAP